MAKPMILGMELRTRALQVLELSDPATKAEQAGLLHQAALDGSGQIDTGLVLLACGPLPGRPARPQLVSAVQVPTRSPFTPLGRAALLHAICHIEFNAINLALDAAWRFAGMPLQFYQDWLRVAAEEGQHFKLLRAHLQGMGHDYGDFDAHDGLWQMTDATAGNIVARMALVPRTLEARGLDATPPIQAKLRKAGDERAVAILDIILRDEVGHVAIGNHWYRWLCARDGLDAEALYPTLVHEYAAPRLRPPFNMEARRQAGFTSLELERLLALAPGR